MRRFVLLICALVFLALSTTAALSLAGVPEGQPDFGSEFPWDAMDIALVRVVSVQDGQVVLRPSAGTRTTKSRATSRSPFPASPSATTGFPDLVP